jgi:hypothetical protein
MILSLVVWHAHALTHHAPESDLSIHFVFAQKIPAQGRISSPSESTPPGVIFDEMEKLRGSR